MRISRKDKKILRAIMLLHTGNSDIRKKERPSKDRWVRLKTKYKVWFRLFSKYERTEANKVKNK